MENETPNKLKTLIEALTHSGSNTLDEDLLKEIKKICKSSQDFILNAYTLIMTQLKKNNSQIRLAAFQICVDLFKRSGFFRENVLKDLHLIFELTAEINTSRKLPPPKSSARILKSLAISTLKEWVKEFGETYKKLKIAYNYFEKCKLVDSATLQIGNSAEQVFENEQERHLRAIDEHKIRKVVEEFNNNKSEIEMTVTSLSNCLCLLLPSPEEFFIPEHKLLETSCQKHNTDIQAVNSNEPSHHKIASNTLNEDVDDNESYQLADRNKLREFGVPLNYNLTLQLNIGEKFKVEKTEENSSVIENAEDCVRLICNRFLPLVKKWIKILSKCSDRSINEIKQMIDLKEKLENILQKHNSIIIDNSFSIPKVEESSDDEFEEVKKEGYEEIMYFSDDLLLACAKQNTDIDKLKVSPQPLQSSLKEAMPSTSTYEPSSSQESAESSKVMDRKKRLLSMAPKLPFDIDLYHWEDEHLSAPTLISSKMDVDKFWGCAGSDDIHEIPNPEGVAALQTRVIEYTGTFEPVKWSCRAPLPNGKLCPRKDRFKCPFHGKVVPRDEMGNVQNKDNPQGINQVVGSGSTTPEFQDPLFLKDLEAATGLNLSITGRKGKKKKSEMANFTHKEMKTSKAALKILEAKKLPGLIDVVKRQNNAYNRLSKKIFNRSSLRRVSSVLNKLDRKKFIDKYADQFNYL